MRIFPANSCVGAGKDSQGLSCTRFQNSGIGDHEPDERTGALHAWPPRIKCDLKLTDSDLVTAAADHTTPELCTNETPPARSLRMRPDEPTGWTLLYVKIPQHAFQWNCCSCACSQNQMRLPVQGGLVTLAQHVQQLQSMPMSRPAH
jgi:hypothetical protein